VGGGAPAGAAKVKAGVATATVRAGPATVRAGAATGRADASTAEAEATEALRWTLDERGSRRAGDALRLLGYRKAEGRTPEAGPAEWVVDAVLGRAGGSTAARRSWRHRFFLVPEGEAADGAAPVEIEPVAWFGLSPGTDAPGIAVDRARGCPHYRIYLVPRSRLLQHEVPVVPLPDREPALDLPGAADSSRWTVLVRYP
jgi:hypothetical protein